MIVFKQTFTPSARTSINSENVLCCLIWALAMVLLDQPAKADVVELAAGIESGRFIDGVNLTDNDLSIEIAGEWSSDSGAYASLACFGSENTGQVALQRGCDISAGWFVPINHQHALTFSIARHDYSSPVLRGWEYSDVAVSWHIGRDYRFELQASDSLLGRGFSALSLSFDYSRALNQHWRLKALAGINALQNNAPVSTLEYGMIGLEYAQNRWVSAASIMFSSSNYRALSTLELDQPEIGVSFKYRFY